MNMTFDLGQTGFFCTIITSDYGSFTCPCNFDPDDFFYPDCCCSFFVRNALGTQQIPPTQVVNRPCTVSDVLCYGPTLRGKFYRTYTLFK
jgi:hypothetical protein